MPYAIEFHFDEATERRIREIWRALDEAELSPNMASFGGRPHISLCACEHLHVTPFRPSLEALAAQTAPFDLVVAGLGVFPTAERVVFLAPVVTSELLALQTRFDQAFIDHGEAPSPYYRPGYWFPTAR